jgi:hypothetical protein
MTSSPPVSGPLYRTASLALPRISNMWTTMEWSPAVMTVGTPKTAPPPERRYSDTWHERGHCKLPSM